MDEVSPRVADSERREVDARLQQAVGDGRITLAEYEERAGDVWRARTRADLEVTTRDLPGVHEAPARPVPAPVGRVRARRTVAVMSESVLRGPVRPGQPLEVLAVMGSGRVDLHDAPDGGEVHVRAVAVMGSVEVVVPRGTTVDLGGMAFMGARDVHIDPARPGGLLVHLDGYAVMGAVEVKHADPREALETGRAAVSLTEEPSPPRGGSYAVEPHGRRPRHRRSPKVRLVGAVVVVAAAFGLSAVVRADDSAVFGSSVVQLQPGQSVDVAALFGSVDVVVPDGTKVDSHGSLVFGSSDCSACTAPGQVGQPVRVRARGAFGSVQVETQSAYDADRRGDGG